ncbi:MAG: PKD domain-containing protein [Thermoplasmata archaeon]|nr:MAG: PKD domain-containing protein [Thermoplasmata archaeon]
MLKIPLRLFCVLLCFWLLMSNIIGNTAAPGHEPEFDQTEDEEAVEIKAGSETTPVIGSNGVRGDEAVTFTNVTNDVGLKGVNGNYFSWTDYDNDGYFDLLINGRRLFRNDGPPDYNFTEVTGPANITGGTSNGVWGDYDNDGYLDFYAGGGLNNKDKLWHNNGNGTFTDVTQAAGGVTDTSPTTAAGWGDFDKDGDLDLYVANGEDWNSGNPIYYADKLYENNGDGTFSDITVAAGIDDYTTPYYGRGVAWGDYDNDGWLDVYISNYRIQHNYLWRNNHDGTFTDVSFDMNVTGLVHYYDDGQGNVYGPYYGHTIGSSWGDLNNDGNLDLWVSNLVHKYVSSTDIRGYICDDSNIFVSQGAPFYNFSDIRLTSGIPTKPIGGAGTYIGDELWFNAAIADFDNDGDLDVYVPQAGGEYYNFTYSYSFLFRNNNDGTFTDIGPTAGIRTWCTYGGAWADFNNDGFMDLVTSGKIPQAGGKYEVKLYKNNGNSNNWLHVQLYGNESNSMAIGARVTIKTASGIQVREVEGGMGCHSHENSLPVEFGLGGTTTVAEIEVRWPNGKLQKQKNVPANQLLKIYEDMNAPEITSANADKATVNEDEVVTFNGAATDPDGSIASYSWDFNGDGISDWSSTTSAGPATYSYPDAGMFNARLTVWDDTGNLGAFDSTTYITVNNIAPTADAGDDFAVFEDDVITFNGSGSTDPPSDLVNLSYRWDFDDDTLSDWQASPFVDHTYSLNGQYDVSLMVLDEDGELDSDTVRVTVNNKLPGVEAGSNIVVAEDSEIKLEGKGNDTVSDIGFLRYKWDFGDGTSTEWGTDGNATKTYANKGTYTITLTVKDDTDTNSDTAEVIVYNPVPAAFIMDNKSVEEDTPLNFEGWGNDNPSDKSELKYLWDFGDGTKSSWMTNDGNTTYTYTEAGIYTATLIVLDGDDAEGNASCTVTVINVAPTVDAGNKIVVDEDELVLLSGTGSDTVSDQDTLEYRWVFGDGSEQHQWNSTPDAEHSYSKAGSYSAILKVRDNNLAEGEDSFLVTVENVAPKAAASADNTNIDENDIVKFSAAKSTDTPSDLPILNYTWDFGDDSKGYGVETSHQFNSEGSYNVVLSVKDDDGERDEYTLTISVMNIKPTATFLVSTTTAKVGKTIIFNASGTTDTENDIDSLTYLWDFGDGNMDTGRIVEHEYEEDGEFTVRLTVKDDNGDASTYITTVTIEESEGTGDDTTGGTPTEKESSNLPMALAIVAVVIIIVVILIMFLMMRQKKKQKAIVTKPEGTAGFDAVIPPAPLPAMPGGPQEAMGPGAAEFGPAIPIMQPDVGIMGPGMPPPVYPPGVLPGMMPGAPLPPPAPAPVKAPFCGECGTKGIYVESAVQWFCTTCNIPLKGPPVPPGWQPEEPLEVPQLPPAEPEEPVTAIVEDVEIVYTKPVEPPLEEQASGEEPEVSEEEDTESGETLEDEPTESNSKSN